MDLCGVGRTLNIRVFPLNFRAQAFNPRAAFLQTPRLVCALLHPSVLVPSRRSALASSRVFAVARQFKGDAASLHRQDAGVEGWGRVAS